jgi:sodium transport system permease protein
MIRKPVRFRPGEALLLFVAVGVLMLGGSFFLTAALGLLRGIAVAQWALIALPVLLAAQARTGNVRQTLALRLPRPAAALGAVLIGASLWFVLDWLVVSVQEHFFPTPKELDESLQALIRGAFWPTILVVAVTPAVCEELLCRGALARALTGWGRAAGVLGSAALFALLHIDPHRLLPTFLLGIALAVVALRTGSTVASMIIHVLNNGAIIGLAGVSGSDPFIERHAVPIGLGALAATVLGFVLVLRSKVTDTTLL